MTDNNHGNKLLNGIKGIAEHYQISDTLVRKFLKMGCPAIMIDNRWYAFTENTDPWFRKLTAKQLELTIPENGHGLSEKGT